MKNIHVLSTPNPSRLHLWTDENGTRPALCELEYSHTRNTQNIYITSDEEIKKDEYYLGEDNNIYCLVTTVNFNGKKIILTTDVDLIKYGVQEIDNDFLEWFVKNPSCEEVEVTTFFSGINYPYEIIIPKEEPISFPFFDKEKADDITKEGQKVIRELQSTTQEETLEEATKKFLNTKQEFYFKKDSLLWKFLIKISQFGAKWQQEQEKNKYSEEEVIELLKTFDEKFNSGIVERNKGINNWFEQFKKK